MAYREEIIEEIKERSDIVSIVSEYVSLKQAGSNYKANCPFHSEKTPSFVVSQSKQLYKCFGCGEGGDVIKFIMKIENVEFSDAIKILADKAGIKIEEYEDESQRAVLNERHRLIDINTDAAKYFFDMLWKKNAKMLDYFIKRGLDKSTIKRFGLGYSGGTWSGLLEHLVGKGYSEHDIEKAGLAVARKTGTGYRDRFINRVMFPIFDYKGTVIGFGGRVIDEAIPKYLNSPETLVFNKRRHLYGLNFAKKGMNVNKGPIIIVEGYMDLIALHQFGIKNSVATLGTSLTRDQALLLKRFTDEVVISYDSDSAGVSAALRGMEILRESGLKVRILNIEGSKDPDEYIRKNGATAFEAEIKNAVSFTQFKIDLLRKSSDMESQEGKTAFCKAVAQILKVAGSPVEIEYHIKKMSTETGISEQAIEREVYGNRAGKRVFAPRQVVEKIDPAKDGIEIAKKRLILAAVENRLFREEILKELVYEDFEGEMKPYFDKMLKGIEIKDGEFLAEIKNVQISGEEVRKLIARLKRNTLRLKSEELKVLQKSLQDKMAKDCDSETEERLLKIGIDILNIENELRKY